MSVGYRALDNGFGYRILNLPDSGTQPIHYPYQVQYESRAVVVNNDDDRLRYEGTWASIEGRNTTGEGEQIYSNVEGSSVELTFVGDYIGWVTELAPDTGKSVVVLDGEVYEVDGYYNPTDGGGGVPHFVFEKKIPYGEHTIKITVAEGITRINALLYHERVASISKPQSPCVILVFDDTRTSHYDVAAPILAQYGYRATAYINPKIIVDGLSDPSAPSRGSWKLQFLRRYGWEITSHGFDHINYSELTEPEIRNGLRAAVDWLQARGLDSAHFAPPYGAAGHNELVRTVAKEFHATYAMGGGAWDPLDFNPYSLNRYNVAQTTDMNHVWGLVDEALENGRCFSMLFHGVVANVSADDSTNIRTDKFAEIIAGLHTRGYYVCRMKDFLPTT